jgi:hypothetical protein
MSIKKIIITAVAIAAVAVGGIVGCGSKGKTARYADDTSAAEIHDSTSIYRDIVTIADLVRFLGTPIDSLPDIRGYEKRKEIMRDEYEAVPSWFGIEYKYQNKLMFFAESDWTNKNIVSRITVFSKEIKEGEVYIGQTFGNVRNLIGKKPSAPDGELYVALHKHPEINLILDISNEEFGSPLHFGAVSISEIPDSLRIESIVIMRNLGEVLSVDTVDRIGNFISPEQNKYGTVDNETFFEKR